MKTNNMKPIQFIEKLLSNHDMDRFTREQITDYIKSYSEADTTYNGWSNYATWRINLELVDGIYWSEEETTFKDVGALSDYIKDQVETMVMDGGTGTAYDYAHAFISEVNYYEIAKHVAETYPKLITGTNTQDGEKI